MMPVALELNDACLAIARDGEVVLAGPGYAVAADGAVRFGAEAQRRLWLNPRAAQRRYWAEFAETPLVQPLGACRSSADLVHRHLEALWGRCAGAEAVELALMPGWSTAQLGVLLGIARDIGMPVTGLVDAALAAARRPCPGRTLWHLQATLGAAWLTRIDQTEELAMAGECERIERPGIEALERGSAEFIARTFVERSRFDPLHDAGSEQLLYDALPEWLAAAVRGEPVEMVLEWRGNRFSARLDAAAFGEHVVRLCEPLLRRLRALASPREPSVLLVHHRLADFPGLVDALLRLPACTPVLLEPGAAARGALRLRTGSQAAGTLYVTNALPWDQPPELSGATLASSAVRMPTHVLYAGLAWRIADGPVHVGTGLEENEYGVRLAAGTQGVSRRHCTIQLDDGRVVVHDQSRFGTLLNGHRIEGSAVLEPGDELAVGQPALRLLMIAEVGCGA